MLRFLIHRLIYMIVAFLAISLVTFWIMKSAPGSFLALNLSSGGGVNGAAVTLGVTPQLMKELYTHYHLNDPWYVQWWFYVWGFITLHMGTSFEFPGIDIFTEIEKSFPFSFVLAIISVCLATVVSITLGIISAVRENTWVDASVMFMAMLGSAIPAYLIAVFLMLIFGVWLHLFPVIGYQGVRYYVLPVLSLALPMIGSTSRYMRNSLIDALHSEYIVTVKSKGGGLRHIILGHALKNSLLPLITVIGPQLAGLMMGTVFIEQMFGIPGLGRIFVTAAAQRDYPLIMDSTLMYCSVILIMNFLVDLTYGILDPRIRKLGYGIT